MTRFFTSDLHLGHTNIIRYCDRPFASVEAMNGALVAAWNATVDHHDEVWVLGDLAMGGIAVSLPVAAQLIGHKHLLAGNHDKPFEGKAATPYEDAGFTVHLGERTFLLPNGVEVLASHFPYQGDSGDRDRFTAHRPVDRGGWLLHGHVHERWRQCGRMLNVGVDAWAGRPVDEAQLAALVDAGAQDLSPLPWPRL